MVTVNVIFPNLNHAHIFYDVRPLKLHRKTNWDVVCEGTLMAALYAHARIDDLDLDARSQWVGKGNKSVLHALGN